MTAQGSWYHAEAFFQDADALFDPAGVTVDVVDPAGTHQVVGGVPTRVSIGHYVFDYPVPERGIIGLWMIHWSCTVEGEPLSFDEPFPVTFGTELELGCDWEALVVAYLSARVDLQQLAAGGGTQLPDEEAWPRWRIQRIGGTEDYPGHVQHPRFQIEAWGGTKGEANLLILALEAAVRAMASTDHALGVVTASDINLSQLWQPDPETARPRYLSDFTLTGHANPVPP